jgi:selenide, water dikinase
VLRSLHGTFNPADYPDLIVGLDDPDDAAIWRLDERRALVATTDFFTPVVDDAYDYGAIAAANALSDVYAMGGRPFLALNIAALPPDLPAELVSEILLGGAETTREAGVVIAGGHTIQDKEPKYGLVVIGFVDPQHILTKGGARPGDKLVLSKPLGFGTTTTALKRQQARAEDVSEVTRWMKRLNRDASSLAVEFDLRGGTDITGFSLLGHAWEIAQASSARLRFRFESLPFVGGAKGYAAEWIFPGGAADNRLFYSPHVIISPEIDEPSTMLLFDPQTSGGLLLCVPEEKLDGFLARAQQIGQPLWVVGEVSAGDGVEVSAQ